VVSIDEADERRARLSVESRRVSGDGASSSSLWIERAIVSISIYQISCMKGRRFRLNQKAIPR